MSSSYNMFFTTGSIWLKLTSNNWESKLLTGLVASKKGLHCLSVIARQSEPIAQWAIEALVFPESKKRILNLSAKVLNQIKYFL